MRGEGRQVSGRCAELGKLCGAVRRAERRLERTGLLRLSVHFWKEVLCMVVRLCWATLRQTRSFSMKLKLMKLTYLFKIYKSLE